MEKGRLEAFSDGVLAIIITIMVLELGLPGGDGFGDLLELAPTLRAYVISFLFVAIYWVNHHQLFHDVETVNVKVLWCNIAWLFAMSLVPFSTAWIEAYPESWIPLSHYFADMAVAAITFHLMMYLIARENGRPFKLSARNIVSLVTYCVAAAIGGLCPVVAYAAVAIVTCWWIVPAKVREG